MPDRRARPAPDQSDLSGSDADVPVDGEDAHGPGQPRARRLLLLGLAAVLVVGAGVALATTWWPGDPSPGAAADTGSGFPNASNTGVPSGVALTPSGPLTVTTNGAVIDALDVTGCIDVRASNVTIKNTRVRYAGGCSGEVVHVSSGTNLTVADSELDGQRRSDCGESIGYSNYTVIRTNMHHCTDGPRIGGNATIVIRDSYIHDLSDLPGDHGDGIQCYQGTGPVTIQHNTIQGAMNAAFMTADYCSGTLAFDNNLLFGGGFTFRLYDNTATVTNNVWVRNAWEYGPVHTYSAAGAADPGTTIVAWTNNRIANNPDGTGLAELIPQP